MTTPHLLSAPVPGGAGHAIALARASSDGAAAAQATRRALRAACEQAARQWIVRRRAGAARTVASHDGTAAHAVLSVSHRDGRAAALVAPAGWRVGVDLERRDAVDAAHARYFLDRAERAAAETLGLATLWALKEAAWKALALDAATPFRALRVRVDGARVVAVALDGRDHVATTRLSTPWAGWVLAAVWLPPVAARVAARVAA